jgi:AraC-like DNA-binding protein
MSVNLAQRQERSMNGIATLMSSSAYLQELALTLERYTEERKGSDHFETAIEGLCFFRSDRVMKPLPRTLRPAICLTIQGAGWALVGEKRYDYEAGQGFILSAELPCRCTVAAADPLHPYFGIMIQLDRACTQKAIEELGIRTEPVQEDRTAGAFVLDLSLQLLDCALRSVRLLDIPEAIPMLYPGIMREICYWLLTGGARAQIVESAIPNGHDRRVLEAIKHLRGKFTDPISVEELANIAGMSPATFHRQFKSVTSMSPLQYLKQVRLLEARRLMITSDANVENVACEVGYVSASQFSREYTRMFGKPPRRDVSDPRLSQPPAHVA